MRVPNWFAAFAMIAGSASAQQQTPVGDSAAALEMRAGVMLRDHMRRCWRMPTGASDPERLVVAVAFELNTDGSLLGEPRLLSPSAAEGDVEMQEAIESALAAVAACAPYPFSDDAQLRDHYELWREVELVFRAAVG